MEYIPLEKPIADLEQKIDELRRMATVQSVNLDLEIRDLEVQAHSLRQELFSRLGAYETTQLSRHPRRPNTLELISALCSDFVELHGDRNFFDDPAIVAGLATFDRGHWPPKGSRHQG